MTPRPWMLALLLPVAACGGASASGPTPAGAPRVEGPKATARLDGDVLTVTTEDRLYAHTCSGHARLFVRTGNAWTQVGDELPGKGNYELDGQVHGYGMCDVDSCGGASFVAYLQRHEKVGQKDGRDVYRSVPLTGPIKVEFPYAKSPQCADGNTLTVYLDR